MKQITDAYSFDSNGIYCGCIRAQLCPVSKKEYLLPADAVLDAPPKHNAEKEYALRDGDQWLIRPRLAGTYYHTETLGRLDVIDPFEGDLSDYTKLQPIGCNQGDKQVFKAGKWVLTMGAVSLTAYRERLINLANAQCQSAIVAKYPPHKQMNLLMEAGSPDFRAMTDFITEQRAKCKALKAQIAKATQDELKTMEEQLNAT